MVLYNISVFCFSLAAFFTLPLKLYEFFSPSATTFTFPLESYEFCLLSTTFWTKPWEQVLSLLSPITQTKTYVQRFESNPKRLHKGGEITPLIGHESASKTPLSVLRTLRGASNFYEAPLLLEEPYTSPPKRVTPRYGTVRYSTVRYHNRVCTFWAKRS